MKEEKQVKKRRKTKKKQMTTDEKKQLQKVETSIQVSTNSGIFNGLNYNLVTMKDSFQKLNKMMNILYGLIEKFNSIPNTDQKTLSITTISMMTLMSSIKALIQTRIRNSRQFNNSMRLVGQITGNLNLNDPNKQNSLTQSQKLQIQKFIYDIKTQLKQQFSKQLKNIMANKKDENNNKG